MVNIVQSVQEKRIIPYYEARQLIHEADVLLFRSTHWHSWFLRSYTGSPYTHAGLVTKHNGSLEIVEFHGIKGGIIRSLPRLVQKYPGKIDVYRLSPFQTRLEFSSILGKTELVYRSFIPRSARQVTKTMRKLTGLPYGWKRIWWFAKRKLVGLRLFYKPEDLMDDSLKEVIYPVCSTAVAYAFSANGFDLIKNRSDEWTEPGHLALSPNLNELFTLGWDEEKDSQFLS